MMREPQHNPRPLGLVWIDCPRSVVSAGLVRALEKRATVHQGLKPPKAVPSCIILCANSHEGGARRTTRAASVRVDQGPLQRPRRPLGPPEGDIGSRGRGTL